jgi:alpha-L-arabinofuranosidase
MKDADPSIRLLSSYPSESVIRAGAELLDFVSPHHYGCSALAAMEANIVEVRANLARYAHGRDIRIAVTEWNTTAGDWGPARAGLWTLANALACSRYHNLIHRHADMVEIANRSNLTNSFCSGILQTDTRRLYRTPTYFAQQLYATRAGSIPLPAAVPSGAGLDISATADAKRRQVTVFVVNDSPNAIPAALDAAALGIAGGVVRVTTLADRDRAGEPDVTNTFDRPDRIAPATSKLRAPGSRIAHTFEPLSLTVLEWKAERSVEAALQERPDL